MSGPLSSNEIEDVVSSVRRLVSLDAGQRPGSPGGSFDRLVLTPSLRVVGDQPAASPLILTDRATDGDDLSGEAGIGPVFDGPGLPDPDEAPMAVDVGGDLDGTGDIGADWEDDLWSDPDPTLAELALSAEEAELVATTDAGSDAAVPQDAVVPPDDDALTWARFEPDLTLDAIEPVESFPAMPMPEDDVAPAEATKAAKQRTSVFGRGKVRAAPEVQALELGGGQAPDIVSDEPVVADAELADHGPLDAGALDAGPLDAGPLEAGPKQSAPLGSTMPQTLTDTEGNPLTVLDEAALHDIIRQLIREELKGALGERITHNVRKLVRAEINRTLTARSLD